MKRSNLLEKYIEINSLYESNNLSNILSTNALLEKQVSELLSKVELLSSQQNQIKKQTIYKNLSNDNILELYNKLNFLAFENERLSSQISLLHSEKTVLNENLRKISKNFTKEKDHLNLVITNNNNELNEMKSYINKTFNENNLLGKRNQLFLDQINKIFSKLKISEKEMNNNNKLLMENEDELLSLQKNKMVLEKEKELKEFTYDNLYKQYENLNEKYFKLKSEIENYTKIYNEKIAECLEKDNSIKNLEKNILKIVNEKAVLETDHGSLLKEKETLNKKVNQLSKIINENEKNINQNNMKLIKQEKINIDYEENNKKLNEKFEDAVCSNKNLEAVKVYYAKIIKERESKIFEILNENNILQKKVYELKGECDNLLQENKEFSQKIKEIEISYNQLHQILLNKHQNR